MSLSWSELRPWKGSQHSAFEELCCQLAKRFPDIPEGAQWQRVGAPDAGVECFWTLPDGCEWAWQAKYFLRAFGDSQWNQIDKSVQRALDAHPQLTKYFICFPTTLTGADSGRTQSGTTKWKSHLGKWKQWSVARAMSVNFVQWDESLLLGFLSDVGNAGLSYFWFSEQVLTPEWFRQKAEEIRQNVGTQYLPELNVDVPVSDIFDGLLANDRFRNRIREAAADIPQAYESLKIIGYEGIRFGGKKALEASVEQLLTLIDRTCESEDPTESLDLARSLAEKSGASIGEMMRAVDAQVDALKKQPPRAVSPKGNASGDRHVLHGCRPRTGDDFEKCYSRLSDLSWRIGDFVSFLSQDPVVASQSRGLLLVGEAGMGKTHCICDRVVKFVEQDKPAILVLGRQFHSDDPWSQILKMLDLKCTRDEFLGALDSSAEASNSRALLAIDALNETQDRSFWISHLPGMIAAIRRFKRLALVISVRSTYERYVVPKALVENGDVVRVMHRGFEGREPEAMSVFFRHFGIEMPSVPFFHPEFENPLFLLCFCEGTRSRGAKTCPTGIDGITQVFRMFLESQDDVLVRDGYLELPQRGALFRVLAAIARRMTESVSRSLSIAEACRIIESELGSQGLKRSVLEFMINTNILLQHPFSLDKGGHEERVAFAYERLGDHLIAMYLLDVHVDPAQPKQAFQKGCPLHWLVADVDAAAHNGGILEALAIQLPERTKTELSECAPEISSFYPFPQAFIQSIIFRSPHAFTDGAREYVKQVISRDKQLTAEFFNALIAIAGVPDHPWNADRLHGILMKPTMAERDSWWSIYLHQEYEHESQVDRLVNWASSTDDKSHISNESVRLCSTALAWFLTSSQRFLRDRATKGLVRLLTGRDDVLLSLLDAFKTVNDPYVAQRLYAVAYGCAMRPIPRKSLRRLALYVYRTIFKGGNPPPDVLLRDYARGIVSRAMHLNCRMPVRPHEICPPYKSDWPTDVPSLEELQQEYGRSSEPSSEGDGTRQALFMDIAEYSDFMRYVVGDSLPWTRYPLSRRRPLAPEKARRRFAKSLDSDQAKIWKPLEEVLSASAGRTDEGIAKLWEGRITRANIEELDLHFRSMLSNVQKRLYEKHVFPHIANPTDTEGLFDMGLARRWLIQRVFSLGWKQEWFGHFDRQINELNRSSHKAERIGKKYQWIAYHELLARLADNFHMREETSSNPDARFEGPWQEYVRDIDPSCLISETRAERWAIRSTPWWIPAPYAGFTAPRNDRTWLEYEGDLPDFSRLLEMDGPNSLGRLLTLYSYQPWAEKLPLAESGDLHETKRTVTTWVMSYVVRKKDVRVFREWVSKKSWDRLDLPDPRDSRGLYLGEYHWSPAYKFHDRPYYGAGWIRDGWGGMPVKILPTTETYLNEASGYDCSVQEIIDIHLPTEELAKGMGLDWRGKEGRFFDKHGNLVAFDPSVEEPGPLALLISKEAMSKWLSAHGWSLVWFVMGNKTVLGERDNSHGRLRWRGVYTLQSKGDIDGSTVVGFERYPIR